MKNQLTSRANIQTIEIQNAIWSHLNMKILQKMYDTTSELLHNHLIEAWLFDGQYLPIIGIRDVCSPCRAFYV